MSLGIQHKTADESHSSLSEMSIVTQFLTLFICVIFVQMSAVVTEMNFEIEAVSGGLSADIKHWKDFILD